MKGARAVYRHRMWVIMCVSRISVTSMNRNGAPKFGGWSTTSPSQQSIMARPGPVPHWEVSLLVDPPQQPEGSPVLSLKEHKALMSLAEAARDRGDAHRAYSLAEKAYTGCRAISSLLYALDIRMNELKEPAFCAAAYELILGRTLSAQDRTVCELAKCAAIKLLETERERDEASEGAARLAQRAGELRDAAERFRDAAGYSSPGKSTSSTMPTVTAAVVDAVDAAADVGAVEDTAAERGTTPGPQAESSPQWLRQAAPALYDVGPTPSSSTSAAAAPSTSVAATRSPARRIASLDDDDEEETGNDGFNDDGSRPPPLHIPRTPRGTPETMLGLMGRSRCAAASPLYTSRVRTLPFEIQRSREMNASTDSGMSLRSRRLVRFSSHRLHENDEEESTSLEAIAERQRARERERAYERELAYERERARQSERARRTPSTPPLISPLLPRRSPRREYASTLAPRMPQGPCGGVFATIHLLVSQLQSALPVQDLELWLDQLPGLEAQRPPPLLGVRPLERAEVLARFLRMECTLWEAQQLYLDSHALYLRQWIALKVQALYRARVARRELSARRNARWLETHLRHSLGFWQHGLTFKCFHGWRAVYDAKQRVRHEAIKVAMRWASNRVSRALRTWIDVCEGRRAVKRTLQRVLHFWREGKLKAEARAYRRWVETWVKRCDERRLKEEKRKQTERREQVMRRAVRALQRPDLFWALLSWKGHLEARARAQELLRKALNLWLRMLIAQRFRVWKGHSEARSWALELMRKALSSWRHALIAVRFRHWAKQTNQRPLARRDEQLLSYRYLASVHELLGRPCVKRGRFTSRWRSVELRLSATELTYASGKPTALKLRAVPLGWIQEVFSTGPARIRIADESISSSLSSSRSSGDGRGAEVHNGHAFVFLPPLSACWRFVLMLSPLGRQQCGAKELHFGCRSLEAMHCWVEALQNAVPQNAIPQNAIPQNAIPRPTAPSPAPSWEFGAAMASASPLRPAANPPSRANAKMSAARPSPYKAPPPSPSKMPSRSPQMSPTSRGPPLVPPRIPARAQPMGALRM